jgi:hypothetical protein
MLFFPLHLDGLQILCPASTLLFQVQQIPLQANFRRINKQMPLIWIVLVSKSFYNTANITTKYQIVFLKEKNSLNTFWQLQKKHISVSLVEKISPF